MRICLIAKYPPIQGGVSSSTFTVVHRLAQDGHEIDVVTNAREVDPSYRQMLLPDEQSFSLFKNQKGIIRVHFTEGILDNSYIPFANPFSTKLFGLASKVIENKKPDLIIGWYFEPYGFIAAMISKQYDIPCIIRHAGSDLGRLAQHPDLREAYKVMIKNSSYVVSSRNKRVIEMLEQIGVQKEKLLFMTGYKLPDFFKTQTKRLNVESTLECSKIWFEQLPIEKEVKENVIRLNSRKLDATLPTIGIYGKVGITKGSFDLIEVLGAIATKGIDFNFIAIAAGNRQSLTKYYQSITSRENLSTRSFVLPVLPIWKIPEYLQTLDICCFLERDFSISFHTPKVPLEILSSGKCLIISREIVQKNPYGENFVDGKNCIIVDPKDHTSFEEKITALFKDIQKAKVIGKQGKYVFKFIDDMNADCITFEDLITRFPSYD